MWTLYKYTHVCHSQALTASFYQEKSMKIQFNVGVERYSN